MTAPLRGLWIDDAPGRVLGPGYLDELVELGLHTAAVMVESSTARWAPSWTADQARRAAEGLVARDIEPVVSCWPEPCRGTTDELVAWLESVLGAGYAAIEVDLEPQWRESRVSGHDSLCEAAAYLLARLRSLADRYDARLEVTTHPWHSESSPRALVAPHVHRLVEQAYSIRERPDGTLVEWGSASMGPGGHQRWASADARTIPAVASGAVALALGLPAWSQRWPGHDPAEAMQLAHDAAVELQVVEERYWSSKHVLGAQANGYAAAWLRSTSSRWHP